MNDAHALLRMLNLGCGARLHPAWINVDIAPCDPSVIRCDLSRGLPFPDESFGVVYHSSMLEHLRREHARALLQECRRVLAPRGILRVAVPDLEQICRLYLEKLTRASAGDATAAAEYDWLMIELLDQLVRERGGGEMVTYLCQQPLPAAAFVLERIGNEGRELLENIHKEAAGPAGARPGKWWRLNFKTIRSRLCSLLLDQQTAAALAIGQFRLGGEVHQWMYDRFSLSRLMTESGFASPQLMTHGTSQIPGWSTYALEVAPDGTVHKPDTLVMECTKNG